MARGRECQIRIPQVCNGNPDTVVLCHIAGGGIARKQSDLFGAYGCSACHDAVDGRTCSDFPKDLLKMWLLEGVIRTQQILIDEGVLDV